MPHRRIGSLMWQITIPFAVFVAVCFLTLFTALYAFINFDRTEAQSTLENETRFIESRIYELLNATENTLVLVANESARNSIVKPPEFAYEAVNLNEQIFELVFFDKNGIERARVSKPTIRDLTPENQTVETQEYFTRALEGNPHIGSPFFLSGYETPFVFWATPIRDERNGIVGAMRATIDLGNIWGIISDSKTIQAHVVDNTGTLLVSKNVEMIRGVINLSRTCQVAPFINGQYQAAETLDCPGINSGEPSLTERRPIRLTNWGLITELPTSSITSEASTTFAIFGVLFLMAIASLIIEVWLVRKKALLPIRILQTGAEELRKGNLKNKVLANAGNELDGLSATMNNMAQKLLDSQEELKSKMVRIKEEEVKLETITKNMRTGVILLSPGGEVLFTNRATEKILQSSKIDGKWDCLQKLEDKLPDYGVKKLISDCLAGKAGQIPKATINDRIYSISFTNIENSAESPASTWGRLIWIRDITEETLLEESKSEFLAIASHEMRTPLTIIRGNAELILEQADKKNDEPLKKMVTTIRHSSVRLMDIINDFLDITQIESGKLNLHLEIFCLDDLLEETIKELEQVAGQKGLYIKFKKLKDKTDVLADKKRVQQIIINMVSNGLHYTEQGGVEVSIESKDGAVLLKIKDTGIGIRPEKQALLFQKFQTAGETFMHSKEYGSGLGLYITHLLITSMGGDAWLEESTPGKGSTFCVKIPPPSTHLDLI